MEDRFLQHKCKEMKRDEELRTPDGQAALMYYQQWMRAMRRMPPAAPAFLASKYFRTFMNFAQFVKRVNLPKVDKFIALMVERGMSPTMWMTNDVYAIFMEYLDHNSNGIESAVDSVKTLWKYCDKHEIPFEQVFKHMPMNEVIRLIELRKLSPWLLLASASFRDALQYRASPEQRSILETLIRPEYWITKMSNQPEQVSKIRELVIAMGI